MSRFGKKIWKTVPLLRLLIPFVTGILLQYVLKLNLFIFFVVAILSILFWLVYSYLPVSKKFTLSWLKGVCISLLFISAGGIISFSKNISHNKNWVGNNYIPTASVLVTLQEPLQEKAKSYKAIASVETISINSQKKAATGNILVYFKKDSLPKNLGYGSQILIMHPLQRIINSGNPNGFNYQQYCAFQGIYYQTFLSSNQYIILPKKQINFLQLLLLKAKENTLFVLKKFIIEKPELSIAEALLIGYRDDLDRDLVQAYSNTGVVHIIAISGLHIGMIYSLLVMFFSLFKRYRFTKIIQPILILLVLWGFTAIAGAAPSILRSTIMFSFIVLGNIWGKKNSIYNNLAASAFCILIMNPFSLWDVGFQLSYAAVLSIVLFSGYIKKWLYFKNKLLSKIWELNAVTIAAQILTTPIVLYQFHQFPNLFLLTNLIVVPLSGFVLYAEIILLVVSPINFLGTIAGNVTERLIYTMNRFIENVNWLPFATWNGIQISIFQTACLLIAIITLVYWLVQKKSFLLFMCLSCFTIVAGSRCFDFLEKMKQQKIIVYNVPNHTAIDILCGRNFIFKGDSVLLQDGFLRNFHLQPSRILNRISLADSLPSYQITYNAIFSTKAQIFIIDNAASSLLQSNPLHADALILTKNVRLKLRDLMVKYNCNRIIADASNSMWKIQQWKKEAEQLHLLFHSVPDEGAFEMNL